MIFRAILVGRGLFSEDIPGFHLSAVQVMSSMFIEQYCVSNVRCGLQLGDGYTDFLPNIHQN